MKKLTVEISDKAHDELLRIQLEKKLNKEPRSTVKDIAGDYLSECLENRSKKETPAN